jgi:predicted ribosome quality control (RQC) complex YloA/Tae2 family protein
MEAKRELTSVDLAALARELSAYEGAFFDKAYLYDDDLVRFKLRHHERGRMELLVNVREPKHVRVASPDHVDAAPERPPNFAMMLRNRLEGTTFAGVEQFEFDRILSFRFERDNDSTTVVAELFGDGNLAVLDATGEVIDCLETVRLKSRTVAPGAQYEYPEARFNPLAVDREGFGARVRDSDTDVVRTLATRLNFGGLWGEELCTRAGVDKTLDIDEVTDDQLDALYREVQELIETLDNAALDPRVYYESPDGGGEDEEDEEDVDDGAGGPDRLPVDVTPVGLEEHAALESDLFDTFNGAVDHYVERLREADAGREAGGDGGGAGGRQRPDFEAEIEKRERIIQQQEGAIEDFEAQAEAEREKAQLLYANYDLVDEIVSTIRTARADDVPWDDIEERFADGAERGIDAAEAVVGVDGSEATVTIDLGDHDVTLDVETGVEKNADRLYQEAKRIEDKRAGAEAAVEETRAELADVKQRREEWEADDGDEGADQVSADDAEENADVDWLSRASIPVRQSEQWYEEFRWFHTSDGFLVIGGRNADQNEALVKKYLDRGDKFFHAQAHGGPATILKATGPSEPTREVDIPESSLEQAAQFAVSYSSVWKDSTFAGDVYMVESDQVSKTPESGEYLEKGGFAIRGDRTYFEDTPVGVAVGITCEPETRVIGGPPAAIEGPAETTVTLEPGKFAQNDAAKRVYRELRGRFADESFVRKVASPDLIQEFLPPGGSRMIEE